ncbi:hypothetical protein Tco_1458982 [Tanacetum coccineum]
MSTTRSSTESKTSLAIAANLSELELKKILIEKMESNKRRDDEDKDEEPFAGKEPESTSAPKEKTSKITGKSTDRSKSQHKSAGESAHIEEPMHTNKDLEEPTHQEFDIGAIEEQSDEETSQHPDYLQGNDRSTRFPEGLQYPHDLRKPLPLIPNSHGRQVIPFDHFINNDLAYLSGGVLSRTYATSIINTKATDYGPIKWIKDLVSNTIWSEVSVNYDKHALWGISHWGRKCQQFYGFAANRELARDVYSKHRIIAEGDFKRLGLQDIEYMLILFVQGKLTNLNVEDRLTFIVSLRMFTRSIVIQRRVKDLQLGIESYQKNFNITNPDTYRSDLKRMDAYTSYSNPRGFIYQNKDKKNKLIRIDELHKFSDGTLDDVRTALLMIV